VGGQGVDSKTYPVKYITHLPTAATALVLVTPAMTRNRMYVISLIGDSIEEEISRDRENREGRALGKISRLVIYVDVVILSLFVFLLTLVLLKRI